MEQNQEQIAESEKLGFQRLAAEVSRLLLGARADSLDARIDEALAKTAEFFQVDRLALRSLEEAGTAARLTHEWTRASSTSPPELLTLEQLPWVGERFLRGEVVAIRRLDELPEVARAEAEILRTIEARSAVAIPLVVENLLQGAILASTKQEERDWSDATVAELRLLGEMMASAIARRQAERALREGEERYRGVVESQTEVVMRWRQDGIATFVNDAVCRALNTPREELIGSDLYRFVAEEEREALRQALAAIGPQHPIQTRELRVVTPSGEIQWYELVDRPICDASGRVLEIQSVGRDITQRKHAEGALAVRMDYENLLAELSAKLLRTRAAKMDEQIERALERIGEAYSFRTITFWWFDEARELVTRSHSWRGTTLENLTPSDGPWLARRVLEGQITKVCRLADLPVEASAERDLLASLGLGSILFVPLRVDEALVGFATFSFDHEQEWPDEMMEELQLLANVLASSFARSRAILHLEQRERDLLKAQQVGHVGSYVAYPQTGRVELSDELCAMVGIGPGEGAPDLGMSYIHPEDRERVLDIRQKARTGALPPEAAYRVLRGDGSIRHVHDRWEIQRDLRGEPTKILGTVEDITTHKEAEAALQDALAEVTRLKERLEAENVYLREEVRDAHGIGNLVGESPQLRDCLQLVQQVASTDATVLILGETGTGKELIARALHESSLRREGPLVSVNCAALPETLIESELFGHEKGAFTGAVERRHGRFELASGGTLFLDEIGDLPLHLQAKLLRVLQEGEIERVGGSEVVDVDVRVIGSTNRDLADAVGKEEFRADLYYRISAFPIRLPPLRDREGDIPLLAKHFVRKHSRRLGRRVDSVSSRMLRQLAAYSWPGNVRELEHVIERSLIAGSRPILDLADPLEAASAPGAPVAGAPATDAASLREVERRYITEVLEKANWVIEGSGGAAVLLGIHPSTLRSRMKKLGIERPA